LFFALWPEQSLQVALADAIQDVVVASGGRAVPPGNFHVTLAFVGSVPESSVVKVEAVGAQVAAKAERAPLQLTLDAVEYWKKVKVVCATARMPQKVAARLADTLAHPAERIATALALSLTAAGFSPDLKGPGSVGGNTVERFRPHVTLARKVMKPIRSIDMRPVPWSFTEFVLVQSRTEPQGAVYSVLESFPLGSQQN
jgi:2'-5' RNA ligase